MTNTMTTIDKRIIQTTSIAVLIDLAVFLILDRILLFQLIAVALGLCYMFFILLHLGLCYPIFVIVCTINDFLEDIPSIERLRKNSEILFKLIVTLAYIVAFFFIYVCAPILIAMIFNSSFSIDSAIQILQETGFIGK